jgi:hypothetical protein
VAYGKNPAVPFAQRPIKSPAQSLDAGMGVRVAGMSEIEQKPGHREEKGIAGAEIIGS